MSRLHDEFRRWLRDRLGPYSPVLAAYRRYRPTWLWLRTNPSGRVTRRLLSSSGTTVIGGPFRGMVYPEGLVGHTGFLAPKLLGSYENGVSSVLASTDCETFVDIGAAEGYFSVGMALAKPGVSVVSFEMDGYQRHWSAKLSDANGVRIDLRSTADADELRSLAPEGPTVLLCDIEGAEWDLIDPGTAPWFAAATLVVEVHEEARPGVTDELRRRFAATHHDEVVVGSGPGPEAYPLIGDWTDRDASLALSEGRGPTIGTWLVLRPFSGTTSDG